MSNITIGILFLFVAFWFYCIFSAVIGRFKNNKEKVFWIIGLVFLPFLSFFYIYFKKDLLES